MTLKTTRFDPVDYLKSDADIEAYLEAAMEGGDPANIARAMSDVARARGLTGFEADRTPSLSSLTALLRALGLRLSIDRLAA